MSKIVFLSAPAHGHINPTLPMVQELTQRGESVLYYSTEEFRPQIERTGAAFHAYPQTLLTGQALADSVKDGNLSNSTVLMLQSAESLLPFTLRELEREQPDLVIFDSLAVWGKMASTILKIRAAASISHFVFDLKTGRITFREILSMLRQSLPQVPRILAARSRLIRTYGKDAFPPGNPLFPMRDKLNIVYTARTLQPQMALIDETFRFVGPSITPRPTENDLPYESFGKPLIYISLGTIHTGNLEFFKQCFAAFRDYPAHFILSVGKDTDLKTLVQIPPNFTVRNFVPQLEVLQHCQLFVTHGGMNSIHEGLYYGVPLVIIPQQIEQLLNARCIEVRGAALVINKVVGRKAVTASELRAAVETVLSQPSYQSAATALQEELHATGGYRQAADEIQKYIANH
jgi:MGT family glycosyltransferase